MRDWMYIMYDTPEPTITPRACGGFLAVAPKNAAFRIGVTATTEALVREKFSARYAKWREDILPQPDFQI